MSFLWLAWGWLAGFTSAMTCLIFLVRGSPRDECRRSLLYQETQSKATSSTSEKPSRAPVRNGGLHRIASFLDSPITVSNAALSSASQIVPIEATRPSSALISVDFTKLYCVNLSRRRNTRHVGTAVCGDQERRSAVGRDRLESSRRDRVSS